VILYAESSAVLAWLLGEEMGEPVRELLAGAEGVITSELTLIECDRVLHRAVAAGLPEAGAAGHRHRLSAATGHWTLLTLGPEVVERARRPFPAEPIRSLDALHLASALVVRSSVAELQILSLDDRIRKSARELGFEVVP
jgi:predicted nucleic acid-binding protein